LSSGFENEQATCRHDFSRKTELRLGKAMSLSHRVQTSRHRRAGITSVAVVYLRRRSKLAADGGDDPDDDSEGERSARQRLARGWQ
jgi:hypothetical protein